MRSRFDRGENRLIRKVASLSAQALSPECSRLLLDGTNRLPLLIRVFRLRGQVVDRTNYVLVHKLARLVQGYLHYVPRLIHGALNNVSCLVGNLAKQVGARDKLPRSPSDRPPDPFGRPSDDTLPLLRCLSCSGVCLLGCFSHRFLSLLCGLSGDVRRFLGGLLHSLLGALVYRLRHPLMLGDLLERVLYGLVRSHQLL